MSDDDVIARSLEAARRELTEVEALIAPLAERRMLLLAFIRATEDVMGGGGPGALWRSAADVLSKTLTPLRIPELADAIRRAGRALPDTMSAREGVRIALKRRPDVFEQIGSAFRLRGTA